MPTQHPHTAAQTLAGEVFGRILDREADAGGYAYVLDCLESGKKSLQQIVVEFITSDEFIDRFVSSALPAQSVQLVHKLLLGRSLDGDGELQPAMRAFVRLGLKAVVEKITESPEYGNLVGPDRVPGLGHFPANAVERKSRPTRQRQARGSLRVAVRAERANPASG